MTDYFAGTSSRSSDAGSAKGQGPSKMPSHRRYSVVAVVFAEHIDTLTHLGYVLARNKAEWPADWDGHASFGFDANQRGWGDGRLATRSAEESSEDKETSSAKETVHMSDPRSLIFTTTERTHLVTPHLGQEMQDVIVVERPPPRANFSPVLSPSGPTAPPIQDTRSLSISASTPQQSVTTLPAIPITSPTLTLPAALSSPVPTTTPIATSPTTALPNANGTPRQIGTTPLHPVDIDLLGLARRLDLSEEVVLAAKHIILRHGSGFSKYSKRALTRASLFAACRQLGIARTFNEFDAGLNPLEKTRWHKSFKAILNLLKAEVLSNGQATKNTIATHGSKSDDLGGQLVSRSSGFPASFSVQDFIHSQCKSLGLSHSIRDRAIIISHAHEVRHLFGDRRPSSVAAVILSFAAECEESYVGVEPYAAAANVSLQTIASGQRKLLECVTDMHRRGPLPKEFKAAWNTPGYKLGE